MRGGRASSPEAHLKRCALLCGECSIAAESGADGVGAHDPEMISRVRPQSRDVRKDILVIIASLDLVGRSGSVASGSSILKVHRGAESVGIYRSVKPG
jgi:hypothetical protein